jgi:phage terminase large subunit-like protein
VVLGHPPYSPDLDEDVRASVVHWFQQQPREFFAEGIHPLALHRIAACNTRGTICSDFTPLLRTIPKRVLFEQAL